MRREQRPRTGFVSSWMTQFVDNAFTHTNQVLTRKLKGAQQLVGLTCKRNFRLHFLAPSGPARAILPMFDRLIFCRRRSDMKMLVLAALLIGLVFLLRGLIPSTWRTPGGWPVGSHWSERGHTEQTGHVGHLGSFAPACVYLPCIIHGLDKARRKGEWPVVFVRIHELHSTE